MSSRILLIRHAAPDVAEGICFGRLDLDLSQHGRRQAEYLARELGRGGVAAIYSSPSRRALTTAGWVAAACGLDPVVDPRLQEIDFGSFEGMTFDEIRATHADVWDRWMHSPTSVRFPGGEAWEDLQARATAAFGDIASRAPAGRETVVVSHGGTNRAILSRLLGLSGDDVFGIPQTHAHASVVVCSGGRCDVGPIDVPIGLASR